MMIYRIESSEERNRPQVYDDPDDARAVDWELVGEVLDGQRPVTDYREVALVVPRHDASSWHYYLVPGTLGLISAEATRAIGQEAWRLFDLLPATLNEEPYAFLRCREPVPCFDREHSVFKVFPGSSNIMTINQYAFKEGLIVDPLVFCIPDYTPALLCTRSVRDAVARSGLRGFQFSPLTNCAV